MNDRVMFFSFNLQHCSHLESLSVADNDFGYDGAVAVSRLVRFNKRLKRLNISKNNIAWEALMLIGKALAVNSILEELKVPDDGNKLIIE